MTITTWPWSDPASSPPRIDADAAWRIAEDAPALLDANHIRPLSLHGGRLTAAVVDGVEAHHEPLLRALAHVQTESVEVCHTLAPSVPSFRKPRFARTAADFFR